MVKIVALLGDYWHDRDDAKAGLEAAFSRLPYKEEIDLQYITYEEVSQVLDDKPDLFINAKMAQLNPLDEQVITWLTEDLDKKIVSYIKEGGSILAWHTGIAGYPSESNYIKMLRGYFVYHPPGLQHVTYLWKENEKGGEIAFSLSDEHYFVHCDAANTDVDLWSTSADGDAIAGWKHSYGKGKICCFTPAHTKEGMLNKNISSLLAEKINWTLFNR
ncbi:ThuA domain-containing protein [Priestia megaterium]|uniref:ThuA domain-containing protein n=1 Tax=Priestia megaterium TaxID=1404 RepID=A0A6H1P0U8_PRIMG|nr:ThuA domain-containing protein [Priestia megaterium]QIZ07176.1 ThuA domain-containing protein [Priestia megaterium]